MQAQYVPSACMRWAKPISFAQANKGQTMADLQSLTEKMLSAAKKAGAEAADAIVI